MTVKPLRVARRSMYQTAAFEKHGQCGVACSRSCRAGPATYAHYPKSRHGPSKGDRGVLNCTFTPISMFRTLSLGNVAIHNNSDFKVIPVIVFSNPQLSYCVDIAMLFYFTQACCSEKIHRMSCKRYGVQGQAQRLLPLSSLASN